MTMPTQFEKPLDFFDLFTPNPDNVAVPWACEHPADPSDGAVDSSAVDAEPIVSPAAPVQLERREQERHRTVMRAARVSSRVHRVEDLGVVRNISEGGMMIDAHQNFTVGEPVAVSLLDGDRVQGEVVWKDGTTIGVKFASWMTIDHLLAKPRVDDEGKRVRPPRLYVGRKAIIRIGGYMTDTEICDISQRGAKIRYRQNLMIDSRVQISLGTLRPISGSVKWQIDALIGIEFHRTLSPEELSTWLNQTPSEGPAIPNA